MELSMPLVSVFGRVDGAVLTALSRGSASLNGRQIERLLGGSVSIKGVQGALARLVRTGLVLAVHRQAETLYRANRDHLLWPAVMAAADSLPLLRRRIRDLADRSAPAGASIVLYGSVERGDSTGASDVDLLVILPDGASVEVGGDFVDELARSVELWSGNSAQVIQMRESELRESAQRDDPLVDLWMHASEVLVGQLPEVV
ncbi:nucleotidyltransferase domain-containing protein [Agromyces neolithicus]|uniref:nucleotidyltransferase family protein n=1 Tax=Agromyces neolithicus TaxID=269420 RepID=UPI0031E1D0BF